MDPSTFKLVAFWLKKFWNLCSFLFQATLAPKPAAAQDDDDDDGVDLFGSDDEEESAEAAKIREERLAAYNAKKSKSKFYPVYISTKKSPSVILS